MSSAALAPLSSEVLDPERYVRWALTLQEAEFREMALLALADWERTEVAMPELFRAVAALQRPSWGHWNGLLTALREARKSVLRTGTAEQRDKVKQAATLEAALDFLDRDAGPPLTLALRPLAELTRTSLPRRPKLGTLLVLPIALRNLVAHSAPTDPPWWVRATEALRPAVEAQARGELRPSLPSGPFPSPWFLTAAEGQTPWAFNGLRDDAALYAGLRGEPVIAPEALPLVLRSFNRLLGKEELREEGLKRLLGRLAPEDLKGVLLGDYLVGRPAGSGGFATVHLGTQLSTGRKVAVKILRDGMPEDARARFQQEAVFLSRLSHPNVVSVIGYGEEAWSPPRDPTLARTLAQENWFKEFARSATVKSFIVLEWVEGLTLEDIFQGKGTGRPTVLDVAPTKPHTARGRRGALGRMGGEISRLPHMVQCC